MRKLYFTVAVVVLVMACSPKTTEVISEIEASITMPAHVMEGRDLYNSNCGNCHYLKKIESFTREEWDKVLPPMAKKSKLNDADEAKINEYINWELAN